ncbi:MAG TPA: cytochrome c [Gemmatimonadales bacterium]|nr:cytochrome c [Gemmatimonadales bacterium]
MRATLTVAPIVGLLVSLAYPASAQRTAPPSIIWGEHIPVGGTTPPGDTLRNPNTNDPKAVEIGGKLFGAFNCDGCHAGGAVGFVGPSLADGRWRYGGSDGEIYYSIFYGRPRGMPAWGGTLPSAVIWQLVSYLQSLQPAKDTLATTAW